MTRIYLDKLNFSEHEKNKPIFRIVDLNLPFFSLCKLMIKSVAEIYT